MPTYRTTAAATDSTNASAAMLHDVALRCQLRPVPASTSGNAPSRYGFAEPSMSLQHHRTMRDTHERDQMMQIRRETQRALGDPSARAAILLPRGVCRHASAWCDRQGVAPGYRLRQLCVVPAAARGRAVHIGEHAPREIARRGIEIGVAPRGARTIRPPQLTLRLQRHRDGSRDRQRDKQTEADSESDRVSYPTGRVRIGRHRG